MDKAAIVGDGAWGTTLGLILEDRGLSVSVWSHDPEYAATVERTRRNPKFLPEVPIPATVRFTGDLAQAFEGAAFWVLAVPTLHMPKVLEKIAATGIKPAHVVSVAKGIDRESLKLPSVLIEERLHPPAVGVLSGPSHAPEVARRLPTGVVAAAKDPAFGRQIQDWFATGYFRIYTHADVIGVECGGALKQPIAIAAGICDGLWLGDSTKSSLIARGLAEAVRFGVALGAKRETFSGLSGVGDLITSCMSFHGRNRAVGEALGRGERLEDVVARMSQVAEGVTTVQSICRLADQKNVEMPICREVQRILFEGKEPKAAVRDLMMRDLKAEFD